MLAVHPTLVVVGQLEVLLEVERNQVVAAVRQLEGHLVAGQSQVVGLEQEVGLQHMVIMVVERNKHIFWFLQKGQSCVSVEYPVHKLIPIHAVPLQ